MSKETAPALLKEENQVIREAQIALIRTLINAGIAATDFVPGVGEIPGWLAISLKLTKGWVKSLGINPDNIDLTPDVRFFTAAGLEALEVPTGTFFSFYLLTALIQFKHDLPRIKRGWEAAKAIETLSLKKT